MQEMNRSEVAQYFGDQYTADMRYCLCPDEPTIRQAWEAYQEVTEETADAF